MPFTTGLVTNTRSFGTAASTVAVNTRNITSTPILVLLEVYVVPPDTNTLTLVYVTGFNLAGHSSDTREFSIAGDLAWEVQLDQSGILSEVAFSVFGLDEFGNLVPGQNIKVADWMEITAFSTPIV
ncbi:hypothetical protein [Paenibacillus sp. OV219]|uniref:hypothetical protein n=1 Tax=Paenibacillus sp. OV219 TaxID=1884377 RepID=UPI0008D50438|nr:hypothetical protein [Paenibacillus sp. OV219]SEP02865.1 hypothetical protein SAMN05518847_114113 [Paenibacillus sp. OV219]